MTPDAPLSPAGKIPMPAPSILSDEDALRRYFDQHADAVVAHAASELGEAAHLAPKVLEHVFLNAWRSRWSITSDETLAAFLADAVKHDSARVLSRRMAAQRLGSGVDEKRRHGANPHETAPFNRETSWQHLLREVRGGDSDAAHARAAAIGHHEAAAHIAGIGRGRSWVRPVLTGILVLAGAAGGIWTLDYASRGAKLDAAVMASTARSIESRSGQIGALTLDDGSQVRFAPESRVFIPKEFGDELRAVRIEGAASIQVAPGKPTPLHVKIRQTYVRAEGTAFVVRAFAEDSVTVIAVTEGSVTVTRGKEARALAAGEAIALPDSSAMRAPSAGELAEATSWTQNRLEIHQRRLAEVLPEFVRWYNTRIFIADNRIMDRRVTIQASLDSIRQAIADVEETGTVKFGYINDKMAFLDRTPAPAPKPAARKAARR